MRELRLLHEEQATLITRSPSAQHRLRSMSLPPLLPWDASVHAAHECPRVRSLTRELGPRKVKTGVLHLKARYITR